MNPGFGAFVATYALVFFRAIQQQNVIGGHYTAAMLTSFAIAGSEIAVIGFVVSEGWAMWPWIGAGGGFGGVTAMAAHRAIVRRFGR